MTGEILGISLGGDKIDSSRILLVTKINNRIPRVTKLAAPIFISLSLRNLQFDVITISVLVLSHADPEFPAAGLQ